MSKQSATSSRFVAQLREVSRGTETPMGFGRSPARTGSAILLVVEGAVSDAALLAAASDAGADAVLVASVDASGIEAVAAIRGASANATIGVCLDGDEPVSQRPDPLPAVDGLDFVVFSPHSTSVAALGKARAGLIARVTVDYQTGVLRGLVDLPIDAVEISMERPSGSSEGVSIHDLAGLKQVIDSVRRPLIYRTPAGICPADLRALRDVGLESVLVGVRSLGDTPEGVAERVAEFAAAIVELGGPVGRGHLNEGRRVSLPSTFGSDSDGDDEDDD